MSYRKSTAAMKCVRRVLLTVCKYGLNWTICSFVEKYWSRGWLPFYVAPRVWPKKEAHFSTIYQHILMMFGLLFTLLLAEYTYMQWKHYMRTMYNSLCFCVYKMSENHCLRYEHSKPNTYRGSRMAFLDGACSTFIHTNAVAHAQHLRL